MSPPSLTGLGLALLNTEGCLARAGHCGSAPPSDCVAKGSWATERMVLLCAQAGLKLMALLLPPERLGYMFNRTMLLFLFELFFLCLRLALNLLAS